MFCSKLCSKIGSNYCFLTLTLLFLKITDSYKIFTISKTGSRGHHNKFRLVVKWREEKFKPTYFAM